MEGLKKKILKIGIVVIVGFLLIFIGAGIGSSGAKIGMNDKKLEAEQLEKEIKKEIDNLESEKEGVQQEIEEANNKLSNRKSENQEVFAMIDKKEEIKTELDNVKSELDNTKGKLDDAKSELKSTKDKLATASGKLQETKDDPITLNSGQYVVGMDFPSGRYKATNVGRGSNFFVYDSDGGVVVNTILGGGMVGSGDYVFFSKDGYVIETNAKVKLIPVK
jgi:peptidoglycan hydrolase CwlO-like protein